MFLKKIVVLLVAFLPFMVLSQQMVTGKMVDKKGKGVPGVLMRLTSNNQTILTNDKGEFSLKGSAISDELCYSYDNFKNCIPFQIPSGVSTYAISPIRLDIEMMEEIIIPNKETVVELNPISVVDFTKMAMGGVEQFLKFAAPVSSNNELTSNYNVRGGSYDENLVYVNGFLINRPFLTRSGQQEGMSFIHSNLVESIQFSAGGFQANYGDKLSSVLAIEYKHPDSLQASAVAGLLGVETHVEDVVGKGDRFRYLVGARYRANGYLLNSLPTKGNYNPVFWDAQVLTTYEINERWRWSVLGHISSNEYQFAPQTQKTDFGTTNEAFSFNIYFDGQEDTRFLTSTVGTSLGYFGKKYHQTTYVTAFHSNESESFDIQGQYYINELETDPSKEEFGDSISVLGVGTFLNHARNRLQASLYSVYHDAGYKFRSFDRDSSFHDLRWGAGVQYDDFSDVLSEWRMIDSAGYSLPQNAGDNQIELFETIKGQLSIENIRSHAYVTHHAEWRKYKHNFEVRKVIHDKSTNTDSIVAQTTIPLSYGVFKLDVGTRAVYTTYNNEFFVTPRIVFSYVPVKYVYHNKRFIRRAMNYHAAVGMYHQPPFYREFRTFTGGLNPEVRAQKSAHFLAGLDYSFYMWEREKPFKLSVESYFKYLWDINPYEIENVRIRYYADNLATGYATGLDATLNGEFVPGLLSFLKVSLLSTKEDMKNDFYYDYYNAAGEKIIFGISEDQKVVDSARVEPGLIRRPTDQHLNVGIYFQDKMPGFESFSVQMGLNYGSRLPYGPPTFNRYADTLTIKSYFRVDIGFTYDFFGEKHVVKNNMRNKLQGMAVSFEVFNLLGINNVLSKQWIQDVSGKYYSIPNYLTQRRFNLKLMIKI